MLIFCQIYITILIILIGLHNSEHLHQNGIFPVSVSDILWSALCIYLICIHMASHLSYTAMSENQKYK